MRYCGPQEEWGQVEIISVILKVVMILCPKVATSWAELGARCYSYTGPTTISHFFTTDPRSKVGLLWEVKHDDIMERRTTTSWHPVGPREGSQSFQDTSKVWRYLLKLSLAWTVPFLWGREECRPHEFFTQDWRPLRVNFQMTKTCAFFL